MTSPVGETKRELTFVMDSPIVYEVTTFDVDDYATDSRTFMKHAVREIAKHLLGSGCVKVEQDYNIRTRGRKTAYYVLAGKPKRKLP